ncbi:MAG: fibronectin type III domain-containing protein [Salinispira sp.]
MSAKSFVKGVLQPIVFCGIFLALLSGCPMEPALSAPLSHASSGLPTMSAPTLEVRNGQIGVEWITPTDNSAISAYHLRYREDDSGDWTEIITGIGTSTSHTISGLTNGTSYEVGVRSVNGVCVGNWSPSSAATVPNADLTASPTDLAAAPTDLKLAVGNGSLTATWDSPGNTGNSAISAYHLRYREDDSRDWTEIIIGIGTSHTITELTNGTSYTVQVRAVNAQGAGGWSPSAAATPATVPAAPTVPEILAGNGELVVLLWKLSGDTGGSPIMGYHLRYREVDSGGWMEITSGITGTYNHTITGLINGSSYEVQARFVNAAGAGAWSSSSIAMPASAPSAPEAPTLAAGNNQLTASWTVPTNNGGSAITGYTLLYTDDSTNSHTIIEGITSTSYTITGLVNGRTYTVLLLAENAGGQSDWSASASATTIALVFTMQLPAGTAATVSPSAEIDALIASEDITVYLTTVEPDTLTVDGSGDITAVIPAIAPTGVILPAVNAATGVVTISASTTAGTYVVYGSETGTDNVLFAEYFYVTVSPQDRSELIAQVTAGIGDWGDTADLNYIITTAVTDMSYMFYNAKAFNGDVSGWDTGAVTSMYWMFHGADAFNGDVSGWDVSKVTNMESMFINVDAFNSDISGWNVSKVRDMSEMFRGADAFNADISGWDVSLVRDMYGMFWQADAFNGDLEEWKDHLTLNSAGTYTGIKDNMFADSSVTTFPSWY